MCKKQIWDVQVLENKTEKKKTQRKLDYEVYI